MWTGQRGPESATKNLENSKQSYEKHVIYFVKLACFFVKLALVGDRSTLDFSVKLALRRPIFSLFLIYFSSFWGPFWRSWGAFGALLVPRGAQGDSGPHFFALFSTFGALWAPRKRQKEAQGAQRRPKWCPKWSRRVPKATSKGYFFEISETLIFNDSTMIFMVF